MSPTLRTARLLLRPLEMADAEQAQALFPHWEIVRHLAAIVPWPYPADGALTFFRTSSFQPSTAARPGTGACAFTRPRSSSWAAST